MATLAAASTSPSRAEGVAAHSDKDAEPLTFTEFVGINGMSSWELAITCLCRLIRSPLIKSGTAALTETAYFLASAWAELA